MMRHFSAMWKFRYFLMALVKLDLRQRYRRSVIGIGWSLLNPIAMTVVFTVVFSSLLGNGDPVNYAASVLTGLAVWGFMRDSTLCGCRCFTSNEAYIRQSPIPYTVYTLRTVLGQAIHSLIALAVVAVMLAIYSNDILVLLRLFIIIPGLVLVLFATWAATTISAFITVFFHDTQHFMEVFAQIMFFLTPIMYTRRLLDDKQMGWIADANPIYWLMELTRTPLLTGRLPSLGMYVAGIAVTLTLVGLAAGIVAWLQKRVIFRL
jgi:ABC-type polysaccharide/polyol phosphate export permease